MKNKKVIEIYDQIAEDYASTYNKIDSPEDLVFLDAFLKHLKSGSDVLDLGCGTGFSAGYFQKQGMIAQGVDLSSSMIAIARRNYPDIPFVLQDMRTFVPGKMVDAVWAGYCLFHLEQMDCEATIKKIRKYLKPGGIFGLVLQEGAGEIEPFDPFLPTERIYVHLYTKNEIESILKKYGFTVIEHSIKPLMDEKEFGYNKLLLIAK